LFCYRIIDSGEIKIFIRLSLVHYYALGRAAKYGDIRVSRLFVCLFVRSHISKTTFPTFTNFSVVHVTRGAVAVRRSFSGDSCNMLCTSGFVDDVVSSHNGAK